MDPSWQKFQLCQQLRQRIVQQQPPSNEGTHQQPNEQTWPSVDAINLVRAQWNEQNPTPVQTARNQAIQAQTSNATQGQNLVEKNLLSSEEALTQMHGIRKHFPARLGITPDSTDTGSRIDHPVSSLRLHHIVPSPAHEHWGSAQAQQATRAVAARHPAGSLAANSEGDCKHSVILHSATKAASLFTGGAYSSRIASQLKAAPSKEAVSLERIEWLANLEGRAGSAVTELNSSGPAAHRSDITSCLAESSRGKTALPVDFAPDPLNGGLFAMTVSEQNQHREESGAGPSTSEISSETCKLPADEFVTRVHESGNVSKVNLEAVNQLDQLVAPQPGVVKQPAKSREILPGVENVQASMMWMWQQMVQPCMALNEVMLNNMVLKQHYSGWMSTVGACQRLAEMPDALSLPHPQAMPLLRSGGEEAQGDAAAVHILRERILHLAEAVASRDEAREQFLHGLLQGEARPRGSPMQRVVHYAMLALEARVAGVGMDMWHSPPDVHPSVLHETMHEYLRRKPCRRISYDCMNALVLDALVGQADVHLVDMGSWPGQLVSLLHSLASQPGTRPNVRITAVDSPNFGRLCPQDNMGPQLVQLGVKLNLRVEYRRVGGRLENLLPFMLDVKEAEAVAVLCLLRLHHIPDAHVLPSSPRDHLLQMLRNLEPRVVVMTEMDFSLSGSFFLARFRNVIDAYYIIFDSNEPIWPRDSNIRELLERHVLARDLINLISCEGLQRVVRPESLSEWIARMSRRGFEMCLPQAATVAGAIAQLVGFPPAYSVTAQDGALQVLWNGQPVMFTAAWCPAMC